MVPHTLLSSSLWEGAQIRDIAGVVSKSQPLSTKGIFAAAAAGVGLWAAGIGIIRVMRPYGLMKTKNMWIPYTISAIIAPPSVAIVCAAAGATGSEQILTAAAVGSAAALFCDGAVFSNPKTAVDVYGQPTPDEGGSNTAGLLLFGVGSVLAAAVLMALRR